MASSTLLAAACGAAWSQATPATVRFDGYSYGSAGASATLNFTKNPTTGLPGTVNSGAGAFNITLNNTSTFAAYCIEPFQSFSIGATYTNTYTTRDDEQNYKWSATSPGVNGFDPARAGAIGQRVGQLWAYADATYGVGTAASSDAAKRDASTALQWAIWNVMYDTDNSVKAGGTANSFWISSTTTNGSILTLADTMLAQSANYGLKYNVSVLSAPNNQDQIYATGIPTPVPEPGTFAMTLAGLAAVGFVTRRRRPTQG
ncbi:MAG: PEP-CTERM sorting domain-containing protein [Rubrivivax sp.]